jgi:antimicrobial peptide system SdpA family protein
MVLAATVVGTYAGHLAIPYNALRLPGERSVHAEAFLPEGWKFFTRDPQEEAAYVVERTGDGWVPIGYAKTGAPENVFGASRSGRALYVELGRLLESVPKDRWQPCAERPSVCLERTHDAMHIKSQAQAPQLCGKHGVVQQKPVPWAWRRAAPAPAMPSSVLLLEVEC